jgi:hypothetical protein
MKKVQNLLTMLNDGGSATFASVVAIVNVPMVLTHKESGDKNPLWQIAKKGITKRTKYNVLLNSIYSNMVNNQLIREDKEANFVAKPNWFEPVFDTQNGSIVRNRNKHEDLFLKVAVNSAETFEYFVNGVQATPDQLETIKKFKEVSKKPTNQGTDKPIIIRTISLEGIETFNGKAI